MPMAQDPTSLQWHLPDPDATERLGAVLGGACPWDAPGPRLAYLSGQLGTGKTTLVAALLRGLGVREPVRSPSYALLELYPLVQGLAVHADCYRLGGAQDIEPRDAAFLRHIAGQGGGAVGRREQAQEPLGCYGLRHKTLQRWEVLQASCGKPAALRSRS